MVACGTRYTYVVLDWDWDAVGVLFVLRCKRVRLSRRSGIIDTVSTSHPYNIFFVCWEHSRSVTFSSSIACPKKNFRVGPSDKIE